jgi:hypothetical protein
MHSASTVSAALALADSGLTDRQVSERIGVPRSTVQGWRNGSVPDHERSRCDICDGRAPGFPGDRYAYLLGLYLGDGCISPLPRTFRLRICLDSAYPRIIDECAASLRTVCPRKTPSLDLGGTGYVEVSMYWNHWPCAFPQHGPGKKHLRSIVLASWQRSIVARNRRELIRGLIHSDGCRVIANDRGVKSVRYHFSNLSEDIKAIYCESLDALGIRWTRPSEKDIAVYRKSAVALMDEFVGPKR